MKCQVCSKEPTKECYGYPLKIEVDPSLQVSEEFLDFVKVVSEKENLHDWELNIWTIKGEAECITDMRLICMATKSNIEMMKAWFLHEVAHATFDMNGGSMEDSIRHKKLWRVELNRLLNYLPNISQETILWLKKLE